MESTVLFSEKQRFRQFWVWILLLALNGFFIFALIQQVVLGKTFGDKPMSDTGLIFINGIVLLISFLLLSVRLETRITREGVYVRFYPVHLSFKFYPWSKIKSAFVRQYSPISEYGGWGMRGLGKNKALNVSGNMGLQLELEDGFKLLIGTGKPDEINATLQKLERH